MYIYIYIYIYIYTVKGTGETLRGGAANCQETSSHKDIIQLILILIIILLYYK